MRLFSIDCGGHGNRRRRAGIAADRGFGDPTSARLRDDSRIFRRIHSPRVHVTRRSPSTWR